jgi:hypothetical protein
MDSITNLVEFLMATFRIITNRSDYQDDLRGASPARKVTILLLLLTIFICIVISCLMLFSMK